MDTRKAIAEIFEIERQREELSEQEESLRKKEMKIRSDVAEYWGMQSYGLKVGDKIQWTEETWRKKKKIITIVITEFNCYIRDVEDHEDKEPSIYGLRILKDGTAGKNSDSWYPHMKKFVKL